MSYKGYATCRLCAASTSSKIMKSRKTSSNVYRLQRNITANKNAPALAKDSFVEFVIGKYSHELKEMSLRLIDEASERQRTFEKSYRYRQNLISHLRSLLAHGYGQLLVPVGSTASGLAGGSSDIDLVYISTTDEKQRERMLRLLTKSNFRRRFMTDLKSKIENSSLRKEFDWEKTDIIPTARVPILHLETRGGIQMDVQFEKYASVRNTCYVRHCVEYDPRVSLLNMWAQKWLETQELKDSKHGLFSSYHILMLVLHFLQCTSIDGVKPLLPVMCTRHKDILRPAVPIQRVALSLTRRPKSVEYSTKLSPDLAELVLLFIAHYCKFDLNRTSFRLDKPEVFERCRFRDDFEPHHLSIFDPYTSTTVCRVKGGAELLTSAFTSTKKAMISGNHLHWPLKSSF